MSSTAKSAVSDYEHLKFGFGDENQLRLKTSDDDDFLPLKSRSKNIGSQQDASSLTDSNHNNKHASSLSRDFVNNGFDSIKRAPVPSAWSPGMMIKPNPSLCITPEKSIRGPEKDNILEPRDLNKVPAPVAWSPHHEIKPTVFITPEKTSDTNPLSLKGISGNQKPAMHATDTAKSKEKLSVRFDLPSISSGDEFMDSISDSYSPITIKGKDVKGGSGFYDSLTQSKVYNPMIYSDDSVLDDSIPGIESDAVSLSTSANLVEKLNQLLMSTKAHTDNKLPVQSAVSIDKASTTNKDSSKTLSSSTSLKTLIPEQSSIKKVPTNSSNSHVKNTTSLTSGRKSSKNNSHSQHTKDIRSGAHHLSSSISPYYPPTPGACVVREAKHPMVSTDYSYPFQSVDDNQEHEHIFSRPEYNSTLKVRSELDSLCDRDVDVQKAMEIKLSKSSTKRTEIQEKAAVFTNQLSDQFTNLVDLEPAVDRLCDRVVRMRTCKSSSQKKVDKGQKKPSSHKEPDLMEFYHADLQKESPDLSLLGISPTVPDLIGAPHDQAFDCYRHNRIWNGLKDF